MTLYVVILYFFPGFIYRKFYKLQWYNKKYYRKNQSTPEATKLRNALVNCGFKAEKEKWDGYKTIDIAVTDAKINIEVDGSHHNWKAKQALRDLKRTYYSIEENIVTIRIPNSLIHYNFSDTVQYLGQNFSSQNKKFKK